MTADGLIWWSTPDLAMGLVIRDAQVIACPPNAEPWARGRDARELWREAVRRGMRPITDPDTVHPRSRKPYVLWVPDLAVQDLGRHDAGVRPVLVRRWQAGPTGTWQESHVNLGWLDDGRWSVQATGHQGTGHWLYLGADQRRVRAAAEAKCAALTADGAVWRPIIATYEPGAWPPTPAEVPEWPPGFEPPPDKTF